MMIIPLVIVLLAKSWRCTAFHTPLLLPATIININGNYYNQSTKRFRSGKRHYDLSSTSTTSFLIRNMSPLSDNDNGNSEIEKIQQTAAKLRAEVEVAEKALQDSRGAARSSPLSTEATQYVKPAECFNLNDSCWEITYRFANEPESNNNNDDDTKKNIPQRKIYSGKIQLQLRGDGYTDILSPLGEKETDTTSSSNTATFPKLWGWDLETSAEDSLDYILFSADVVLPPPISSSERFYFQARVDEEEKGKKTILLLNDGGVTVKRNVEAPGGSWWGIFRGAEGILAQFRQVGEFRCRAIPNPKQ